MIIVTFFVEKELSTQKSPPRALDYASKNGIDGVRVFLVTLVAEVFEIFDILFCQVDAVNLVRLGVEFS